MRPTFTACLLSASLILALPACKPPAAHSGKVISSGTAQIGGAYALMNQDGETVTHETFLGKPQMIYFGFSYCPDICPTALMVMGQAQKRLGKDFDDIQYIFISVDPERDTPESLKTYITANGFPEGLIGLTGTPAQVDAAKAAYKVYSAKVIDEESAADYLVDHSSIIYFMDEAGQLVDFFTHTSAPDDIVVRARLRAKN